MTKPPGSSCLNCHKKLALCVCARITPIQTHLRVLILQHPQELDVDLGTAHLAHLLLPRSILKTGLSWPNLHAALGEKSLNSEWAVLHAPGRHIEKPVPQTQDQLLWMDRKGKPLPEIPEGITGILVLDGSWSQSKALWWRNPWLLKLKRIALLPARPSLYGKRRHEPRRECLSTIEAIGIALSLLEKDPLIKQQCLSVFSDLLKHYDDLP